MAGAVEQFIRYKNPQGPLIRQAKLVITRRLSNMLMVRVGLYTYEEQKDLEVLLVCEGFDNAEWVCAGTEYIQVDNTNKMEEYYLIPCKPVCFHRIRAFFMVNHKASRYAERQRVMVEALGVWNVWGRDDGYDEPRTTPLDLFYDKLPLPPLEERIYFPGDDIRKAPETPNLCANHRISEKQSEYKRKGEMKKEDEEKKNVGNKENGKKKQDIEGINKDKKKDDDEDEKQSEADF